MKLNQELDIFNKYKSLPDKDKLPLIFCAIVLTGLLIGCLVCMINTILGKPIFPYGTFVFLINRFIDFFDILRVVILGDNISNQITYAGHYSPFIYLLLKPFSMINWIISFWVSIALFIIFTFVYIKRIFKSEWLGIFVAFTVLISYPFLYAYDRANVEYILFMFVASFVLCYRKKLFICSAFMLAVAISMKLYPAVLIIIFLAKKQFKYLTYCILFTSILTFFGFIYIGANFQGMMNNINYFNDYAQKFPLGLIFGHSLFNLIRTPLLFLTDVPDLTNFVKWVSFIQPFYTVIVLLLFGFISAYLVFINKKFWKSVLILVLVFISFPYISQDYTLIYLTIPLVLLFNEEYTPNMKLYTILIALLFIPMNWITWAYPNIYPNVTAIWCYPITPGLILRPIIILILLYLLIKEDFTLNHLRIGIREYFTLSKKS